MPCPFSAHKQPWPEYFRATFLQHAIRPQDPSPDISFTYKNSLAPPQSTAATNLPRGIFAGERQDLEEIIGNILENAGKSASGIVEITARQDNASSQPFIEIEIIDDGPGLNKTQIDYVLKRGNRLDENKPGTGLGLSIVSDILKEYKGSMHLTKAASGGLRVLVKLPAV